MKKFKKEKTGPLSQFFLKRSLPFYYGTDPPDRQFFSRNLNLKQRVDGKGEFDFFE
jgi:hypothetical protein